MKEPGLFVLSFGLPGLNTRRWLPLAGPVQIDAGSNKSFQISRLPRSDFDQLIEGEKRKTISAGARWAVNIPLRHLPRARAASRSGS
jgi:hypothetical protein